MVCVQKDVLAKLNAQTLYNVFFPVFQFTLNRLSSSPDQIRFTQFSLDGHEEIVNATNANNRKTYSYLSHLNDRYDTICGFHLSFLKHKLENPGNSSAPIPA